MPIFLTTLTTKSLGMFCLVDTQARMDGWP